MIPEAKEAHCRQCGHNRRWHSRNGCEEAGCPCTVKYMEKDQFS